MNSEQVYEVAFEIIVHAGESRSLVSDAMDAAEEYKFEKADQLLEQAKEEFLKCHKIQTEMLTSEANGEKNELNMIFVHAQDHLTMATMAMDNAKRFINILKKLS